MTSARSCQVSGIDACKATSRRSDPFALIAICATHSLRTSASGSPVRRERRPIVSSWMSVSTMYGTKVFTRMVSGASSYASDFEKFSVAALLTPTLLVRENKRSVGATSMVRFRPEAAVRAEHGKLFEPKPESQPGAKRSTHFVRSFCPEPIGRRIILRHISCTANFHECSNSSGSASRTGLQPLRYSMKQCSASDGSLAERKRSGFPRADSRTPRDRAFQCLDARVFGPADRCHSEALLLD